MEIFENKMKREEDQILQLFYYTIVTPKNIRPNTDFTFNLTVHDVKCEFKEEVVVRVSIEDENDEAGTKIHRDITMRPNVTEVVSIPVGNVPIDRDYKLKVKGISGLFIEREVKLGLLTKNHAILIQTDKAIYKPKDCIKFRILVLDPELRPAEINNNELSIGFTDSCRNLLKKWNGVSTTNGVFADEFQLSDLPNLGDWTITASIGEQTKTAIIEVAEYVLPKFEIEFDSPENFTLADKTAYVIVRAKYTNGKPMRGTAVVAIEEDNFYYYCGRTSDENKFLLQKTIIVDGQEKIEFDIENELKCDQMMKNKHFDVKYFKVKAEVTETLTGLSQSTEKSIQVHKETFKISSNLYDFRLKRDSTINVTISVRNHDGSVYVDPNDKNVTIIREQLLDKNEKSTKTESVHELNENGDAVFTLNIAKDESRFSVTAKYGIQETLFGPFYTEEETVVNNVDLKAEVLTEKCYINEVIEIEVRSQYPLESYTYLIISRGVILEAKTMRPENNIGNAELLHRFTFVPNFNYAPEAQILVYCFRDGRIVSTSLSLELSENFNNFIDLNASQDMTKPGDIVSIDVKSNPNSYIGLLGIDQSVLILRDGNDLARDDIWNELRGFHYETKPRSYEDFEQRTCFLPFNDEPWQDFLTAGVHLFTNAIKPKRHLRYRKCKMSAVVPEGMLFAGPAVSFRRSEPLLDDICYMESECESEMALSKPKIRKDFPETWIWDSIDNKSFNGLFNFKKMVPDSLTTWMLTGFSIHPENGLSITKAPLKICVQQQFHISLNLPYSVKRGEVVTIPCSIFNYLPKDIEAEVTLENENNEFDFVDAAISDTIYPEIMKIQSRKKKLTIRSEDALNALFTIRPTKVGMISLKVSAISSTASDCVIKDLNVECEGVPQFVNKAVFIDLRETSQIDPIDLKIDFPDIALPDSERVEITCVGDLLGGTIKNLQSLIRLPYGCGEQNMLNFVPNIVVLNYLKNTLQLTDEIEAKAKRFMEIGYQRELSYKHKNGSFSAFGESDKNGSTWLTAFVAKSFQQAADHILIQSDIVDDSLKWLSEMQADDGSFTEKGNVFHKEMQSGSSNGVALTAYVLTAFLVNEQSKKAYAATIQKAINSITESVKGCTDVYALAVCANALSMAGHDSRNDVLNLLNQLAKSNDDHKWWDKSIKLEDYYYRESKTLNVEVTAYALLTLLQSIGNDSELLPIVKWLLNQRNDQGGFEGTQDTIVGIEALANFAAKIATKENRVNIDVTSSDDTKFSFNVEKDNALVLQSQKLSTNAKSIRINAAGNGFALVELSYRYHINTPDAQAAFSLKPKVELLNEDHISLEIIPAYQPPKGKESDKQSNMVVLEIAMPSGFVVNTEILNNLKNTVPTIKRIETKNGDTVAIIYFDYLTLDPINLKIDGFREHNVDEQKPSSIVIYDYYDNALSAHELYSLGSVE